MLKANPANWDYLLPAGKSLVARECVVADAVDVEPVSASEFPANREKNGEFSISGRLAPAEGPRTQ